MAVELSVSVRNQDVFVVQSGSTSVNDHLMELMIMVNACKMASARRITAMFNPLYYITSLPYFPYNKQSKKKSRGAITAKLIANMLAVSGVDHIITMDLHSSQTQGFFHKPVDNLLGEPCIAKYIKDVYPDYKNGVIICKNAGGTKRATSMADRLNMDFAIIHREKYHKSQTQFRIGVDDIETKLTLVGDIKGKIAFLVDDILDETHSFLDAALHLKYCEASKVVILATHGILSGDSCREIEECEAVDSVVVCNTYPIPKIKQLLCSKLKVIDISGVLAEAIRRTHNGESVSFLFDNPI